MNNTIRNRGNVLGILAASLFIGAISLGIAQAGTATIAGPPESPPVVVTFELEHEAYIFDPGAVPDPDLLPTGVRLSERGSIITTDRFRWDFTSYSDWTLTQICCPDPLSGVDEAGWSKRVTATGTILYRAQPGAPWENVGSYDPADGRTPIPDLAPIRPGERPAPITTDATSWAKLGVASSEMRRFVAGSVTRDVFMPLGIPLFVIERDGSGAPIRTLRVVRITAP